MQRETHQNKKLNCCRLIIPLFAALAFLILLPDAGAVENLLGNDFSKLKKWGAIKNKPSDTGEVKLNGGVLTFTRKNPGGDFKLLKPFKNLKTGVEYSFLCKVKKTGGGFGIVKIISIADDGKLNVLFTQKISGSDEWRNVSAKFVKQDAPKRIIVYFYPPEEEGSSLSVSQMTLLPATQVADASAILKPVLVKKEYKSIGCIQKPEGLIPYVEKNILMNGDFSKKQLNLDLPLFWKHAYGMDSPESWKLYSLKDGVFSFKAPFYFRQYLDISQEIPTKYKLTFSAFVESGILTCVAGYRSAIDSRDRDFLSKNINASGGWQNYSLEFEMKPEYRAGNAIVTFYAKKDASIKLKNVVLLPLKPETSQKKKEIFIDGKKEMLPISGICIPEKHSYYELKAAKYLRKYLFMSAGRYLDIFLTNANAPKKKSGLVYIGDEFISKEQLGGLTIGGFALCCSEGAFCIGGKPDDDGVIQGVFEELRKLGFAFYTSSDYKEPSENILCLSEMELTQNPAFHLRLAGFRNSYNPLGYSDPFLFGDPGRLGRYSLWDHTAPFMVDPVVYFKDHPEYYAMNDKGERKWPRRGRTDIHLCLSNPKVQKIAIDSVLRWIEMEPWAKIFYVYEGDGSDWCQCPKCRAWDVNGNNPARGELTDRLIRFVNIIAREVKKKYPDKLIATHAYTGSRKPPLKEKPESNVIISYCTYPPTWHCTRHAFCPENIHGWKEFRQWDRKFPGKLFIYDYPAGGKTPMGGLYSTIQKVRMFDAADVLGIYYCGCDSFSNEFYYVIGKLLWKPYADVESEISKFMKFYYGRDVFPYFKEYFDMLTAKDMAKSFHRPEQKVKVDLQQGYVIADHDFFNKGMPLLEKALSLAGDDNRRGFEEIERQKMKLLTEYVLNYNKASGLEGEALNEFARNLGEMLSLCKKYKLPYAVWWLSMREMLLTRTHIDIGPVKPWHKSPVVNELIKNPLPLIAKKVLCYKKTDDGLKFNVSMMTGGQTIENYQYKGVPKIIKASSKALRRASSPYSRLAASFELDETGAKDAVLKITGLDDEKESRALLEVTVNGKTVFKGENTFGEKDWSEMEIKIPASFLVQGENTLAIQNITKDKDSLQGTRELPEAPKEDYSWGWMLISGCKLKF